MFSGTRGLVLRRAVFAVGNDFFSGFLTAFLAEGLVCRIAMPVFPVTRSW